jgi:hypothetical protein
MRKITKEKRAEIIAALNVNPDAAHVARQIGGVSHPTIWNIAKAAGIELTAGNAAKGGNRFREPLISREKRVEIVVAAFKENPRTTLRQVARQVGGVSHETVRTIAKAEGITLPKRGPKRSNQHVVGNAAHRDEPEAA